MAKSETMKQPEYSAWLIRHAGRVLLIGLLGLFIPAFIVGIFAGVLPDAPPFTEASATVIAAIIAPVVYSPHCIIFMRQYGAREQVIKRVSMIVFFVCMLAGVFLAWRPPEFPVPSHPAPSDVMQKS
jgi:MFS superfamily sulfate permease-like transporter